MKSGVPRSGDNHEPDEWNPDLSNHGYRDGRGENFTADEFSQFPGRSLSESSDNFHSYSDLDSSTNSQHHTLGSGHNQSSPGDHIHDGGSSKKVALSALTGTYKDIPGLFALIPQTAAITGITDASGFLVFNHSYKDINGNNAAPSKIFTQVHDTGTPGFGNIDIIDASITSTQAKAYCVGFSGAARVSATVNFWIECYG